MYSSHERDVGATYLTGQGYTQQSPMQTLIKRLLLSMYTLFNLACFIIHA